MSINQGLLEEAHDLLRFRMLPETDWCEECTHLEYEHGYPETRELPGEPEGYRCKDCQRFFFMDEV